MDIAVPEGFDRDLRQLGAPVAEFKAGPVQYALALVGGLLAVLVGLVALAGAVFLVFEQPRGRKWVGGGVFKVGLLGLFLVGAGIGMLRRARGRRGLHVLVFTDGLARLRGGPPEVLRWDEVNAVRRAVSATGEGITVSKPVRLTLVSRDGREWEFDEGLTGLTELRDLAERHTLPFMLPPAQEAVDAGAAVGFGLLGVSRDGWQHDKAPVLPWEEFRDLEVVRGRVTVYSQNGRKPFGRIDLEQVPNVHVLQALAEWGRQRYAGG
jgi:hypothetical protein